MNPGRLSAAVALGTVLASPAAAQAPGARGPAAAPDPIVAAADNGRVVGAPGAKLWMLIVSDFQCPFCKQWHDETWSAIRREFVDTGKLRVAYVNFPLGIHPNATPAAVAAMCASAQGKFWAVADGIFATQDRWKDLPNPRPFLAGIARSAGADAARLQACMDGSAVTSLVDADRTRMARAGTRSTPTFFIGGARLEGALPIAQFRRVIAAELAKIAP